MLWQSIQSIQTGFTLGPRLAFLPVRISEQPGIYQLEVEMVMALQTFRHLIYNGWVVATVLELRF